eukprot:4393171-Prymnesium_polylepis.2
MSARSFVRLAACSVASPAALADAFIEASIGMAAGSRGGWVSVLLLALANSDREDAWAAELRFTQCGSRGGFQRQLAARRDDDGLGGRADEAGRRVVRRLHQSEGRPARGQLAEHHVPPVIRKPRKRDDGELGVARVRSR